MCGIQLEVSKYSTLVWYKIDNILVLSLPPLQSMFPSSFSFSFSRLKHFNDASFLRNNTDRLAAEIEHVSSLVHHKVGGKARGTNDAEGFLEVGGCEAHGYGVVNCAIGVQGDLDPL